MISSADEERPLNIDSDALQKSLVAKWPDIDIRLFDDTRVFYKFEWQVPGSTTDLEGGLDNDGKYLYVDGQWEDCLSFAAWFRSQTPADQRLLFYDSSFNNSTELKPGTTEIEIEATFAPS